MKNILVTGGAGYIGSHTVVELVAAGYNPIIIDNFTNSKKSFIKKIEKLTKTSLVVYDADFADTKTLDKITAKYKIDGIIHFAAFKLVGESTVNPLKYYHNNVAGMVSFLEYIEKQKLNNLVFSSSCTVYGNQDKQPITEEAATQPAASPYGATKQFCEIMIRDTAHASNSLKALALRYFNPIGAHPSSIIGEVPNGKPTILVPFITQTVAGWRDKLTVFGNDYPTPDGTNIRDYIHVVDLAKAHVKAIEYLTKQPAKTFDVINIGTGKGTSVLEMIETFEKATGEKVPYEIGPRREGDLITTYASCVKANKLLGWKTEISLEQSLIDAWNWQKTLKKPKE